MSASTPENKVKIIENLISDYLKFTDFLGYETEKLKIKV